ncbi:TetR/AcrR family transcriptional regulator [Actinopolymorpha alba]|uniref:TetR/AcrR family transcriptional regulator n=1 Tax=Actinopolymorpha alba TaxID=533267 RepID=UPI00036351ED|nr:TetR family transcriptional regulator [Actinopolymorpha alba]
MVTPADGAASSRRDRKKRQTRDALSRAAVRLAAEHGAEHVTVDAISEAADVSTRTFFNYFASKDEAITGHDPTIGAEFRERVVTAPADLPPLEAIRRALDGVIAHVEDDREQWILRMTVIERSPSLLPRLLSASAADECALAHVIADRTGTSVETDSYPSVVAAVTGAVARVAVTHWATSDRPKPLHTTVDEVFDMLSVGLVAPTRPRRRR